jgi:hypothetical protein
VRALYICPLDWYARPMRLKPKVKEVEALLCEILADDEKQTNKRRRTIPPEVADAIRYLQVWKRASTKLDALVKLAQGPSAEIVEKVISLGNQKDTDTVTKSPNLD